jgi:hypothetical protein
MNLKSGSLLMLAFLSTALAVPVPAGAQEVIADDLIVQGDLCAGIDCIAAEVFGLDSVKIKENNTRLLFEDTSTTAGFASTDWRLVANDTTSGGVNRFSIEDATAATVPFTIRGAAPSNSLFISNLGRVGIGTSTPDARLDVEASGSTEMRLTITGGNVWRILNDATGFGIQLSGSPRAVNVDTDGNMEILGMLTQGSSRDLKTGFDTLDPREALHRVTALPVSLWSYKSEGTAVRHLGPMAEDFHRAFGLGTDDKHIAPSDQSGVALLALQGLTQVVREKDRTITELSDRVAALERMVLELAEKTTGQR